MYDITQFRTLIIQPALKAINTYSTQAEELLVATCAQESLGGTYIAQLQADGQVGPAYGWCQMEDATHDSLWKVYLAQHTNLGLMILRACNYRMQPNFKMLMYNSFYAAMMARVFYMQFSEALPAAEDIEAIWAYYKKYWNTDKGAATHDQFVSNYYKFTKKITPKKTAS